MKTSSGYLKGLALAGTMLLTVPLSCGNDDDTGDTTDTSSATDSDTGNPVGCDYIDWGDPGVYLVNGGTVANWEQTAFVDADGSGFIDKEERVDADISFYGICETGKKSLLLLIATDD